MAWRRGGGRVAIIWLVTRPGRVVSCVVRGSAVPRNGHRIWRWEIFRKSCTARFLAVVELVSTGNEEIPHGTCVLAGDFTDDARRRAEDVSGAGQNSDLRGFDINLDEVWSGKALGEPIQRDGGDESGGSDAARLVGAEAVEVAGGAVAPGNVKPGQAEVICGGQGQHVNRCVARIRGHRSAEHGGEQDIRLQREDMPLWPRSHRGSKAEQAKVGTDIPDDVAGPYEFRT